MSRVTDGPLAEASAEPSADPPVQPAATAGPFGVVIAAAVLGGGLTECARLGPAVLLAGVAAGQVLFVGAWYLALVAPGRRGALVVLLAAAAASDVVVTQWPHARLDPLLPVLGLAMPALFLHQLGRGVARVRLVESLGTSTLALLAVIALPAFVQLRHEFVAAGSAAHVASAAIGAAAAALVGGQLADMVAPAPRFDPEIARGLFALLISGAVGGSVGYLVLRDELQFRHGRGAFVGAACGLIVALFAVAADFALRGVPARAGSWAGSARPVFTVLLALSAVAPVAYLVCLAVRV
jgi:hypothetical protein